MNRVIEIHGINLSRIIVKFACATNLNEYYNINSSYTLFCIMGGNLVSVLSITSTDYIY